MSRTTLYLLLAFLLVAPCHSTAQLKGDPTLLKIVANQYRANLDQLRTWKGKAEVTLESETKDKEKQDKILIQNTVEFAYDAASGAYRFDIDIYKDVSIVEGKEQPRMRPKREVSIFTGEVYYDLTYKTDIPPAKRVAYVRPEKHMQPGIDYVTFEPHYYFTENGTSVDEHVLLLHDNFTNEKLHGEVIQEGDVIKVIQTARDIQVTNEMWFDLTQGGNLVKYESSETNGADTGRWTTSYEWKQVDKVWMPNRVIYDRDSKKGERIEKSITTVKWIEHRINMPLPPNEFELEILGLSPGDRIRDTRTQTWHIFE